MDNQHQNLLSENSPLVINNRTAIRNTTLQTIIQLSDNSRPYLAIKLLISIIKIISSLLILTLSSKNTSKPLDTFIIILLSAEILYAILTIINIIIPQTDQVSQLKKTISILDFLTLLVYLISQILGNIWFYSCDSCFDDAKELTLLSFIFIVLGYIYMFIPCLICCCICLCLPILIIAIIYANPGQQAASEVQINRLKNCFYKDMETTCKECVICFSEFEENDQVITLDCDVRHVYHSPCLKRWLRINNTCPICRKSLE
ncbi:hypothetical protein SteCoe_13398 [Stentor coeruleus]|uniref:RING-type domain-containing protein n=1 Tax=Stentor coeruleus TaxID=5963 RepID=A0A1R2C8G3_9CILI|nr:hypothetical protein SteCoe_13398 [Stentor coeruleus]